MTIKEKKELFDDNPNELLLWFMEERESIRVARDGGYTKPWTTDPHLQRYRFCNVFRQYDKVTRHYMDWISPLLHENKRGTSFPGLVVFNTMLYRIFNQPATMDAVGLQHEFSRQGFIDLCEEAKDQGIQLFNSAYMITNANSSLPKHELVAKSMLEAWEDHELMGEEIVEKGTLQFASTRVCAYYMVGPFLGYEVGTDLCYHMLRHAPDINEWANLGPGAKRGLNRLKKRDIRTAIPPPKAIELMKELRGWLNRRWNPSGTLILRDVEHSLCEFDKYCRVLFGEGRPKTRFNGTP
jgi:hypothetical protein